MNVADFILLAIIGVVLLFLVAAVGIFVGGFLGFAYSVSR